MKKTITTLLLMVLLVGLCAPAFAALPKLPANVNPQQMGHPQYLEWLYGEKKAKEILESYGPAYSFSSGGLLETDGSGRDGTFAKPYVYGATESAKFKPGVYFTTMGIVYYVYEYTVYNGRAGVVAYQCDASGKPDPAKTIVLPI